WQMIGHKESITLEVWPKFDPKLAKDETIELPIQVNGKLRATIQVVAEISETEVRELALAEDNVQKHLEGKEIKKVVYVPGRLINFVI
ncbi:MAG: class I tRNA ligase family protein, partial [Candidatus Uhrbacteria bacterium]